MRDGRLRGLCAAWKEGKLCDGEESLAKGCCPLEKLQVPQRGLARCPAAPLHLTTPALCEAPHSSYLLRQALHLVPASGPLHSSSLFSALAQLLLSGAWGTAHQATFHRKISLGVGLISPQVLELAYLDLNPGSTSYEALCLGFLIGKIETVVGLSSEGAKMCYHRSWHI